MTDNPEQAIDVMRERLTNRVYDMSDADAQVLLDISNRIQLLGASAYSDHRHEFLLRRGTILAKRVGGLSDALNGSREQAETLVRWINTEQTGSPETNKDYRVALRTLGAIYTESDDPPDSLAWIPGGYPSTHDPAPAPETMYKWAEHIVPMLDQCRNSRDRALIAFAWDVGPRPSELFDLTIDCFSDHDYGMRVSLRDGKRGTRSPVMVPSVPYVRKWLADHPSDSADAPMWSGLNSPKQVTNNRIRDVFTDVIDRCTFRPPSKPTPSRMRKSSASYLASQGVKQSHLEDHHGWTRGSKVAARYIAVFDESNALEIASAHGIDVEADRADPTGPAICPRCDQKTPREKPACMWCGQALSKDAADVANEQRENAMASLPDADAEVAEAIQRVESLFGDNINVRIELD